MTKRIDEIRERLDDHGIVMADDIYWLISRLEIAERLAEAARGAIYTAGSPHQSLKDCELGKALEAWDKNA